MNIIIRELNTLIKGHPATNNAFFQSAKENPWTLQQLEVVGPEYYHVTACLPAELAALAYRVNSEKTRSLLVAILYSELGSEEYQKAHYLLFKNTLVSSGLDESLLEKSEYFEETEEIVNGFHELFATNSVAYGLGAEYALELQSLAMIHGMHKGFGQFCKNGADTEFFQVHAEGEPQHIANMKECIIENINEVGDMEDVMAGCQKMLELWAEFWGRLHLELNKLH